MEKGKRKKREKDWREGDEKRGKGRRRRGGGILD